MKKIFFLFSSCFLFSFLAFSSKIIHLDYRIKLGFVTAGKADFFLGDTLFQDKPLKYTKVLAQTTSVAGAIFPVKDRLESYYDGVTALPVKATYNISEGSKKYYNRVVFDQGKKEAAATLKDTIFSLKQPAFDVLSALYYIKYHDLSRFKAGEITKIPVLHNNSFFVMQVKYMGIETIEIDGKKYGCHKFMPSNDPNSTVEQKTTIWISDDKNKIPVCICFELPVANLKLELLGTKNLHYPLAAK
jgi:hypothetical protein